MIEPPPTRGLHRDDEAGIALIATIFIVILCVVLASVVLAESSLTSRGSKSSNVRVATEFGADSAFTKIEQAFHAGLTGDDRGWVLSAADIDATRDNGAGSDLLDNSSVEVPAVFRTYPAPVAGINRAEPVDATWTARENTGTSADPTWLYWQVVRVLPPNYSSNPSVTVWVRTWLGSGPGQAPSAESVNQAKAYVGRIRPPYFSDDSLIINGPATFGPGSFLDNARMIVNAVSDDGVAPAAAVDARPLLCGNASRIEAVGLIDAPLCGNKRVIAASKRFEWGAVSKQFSKLQSACTAALSEVTCVARAGFQNQYDVQILDAPNDRTATVTWSRSTGGSGTISVLRSKAILFDGEVRINAAAAPDARITIAAYSNTVNGAANIWVNTNLQSPTRAWGQLGIMAQGDVVVPCTTGARSLDAAVISQTGSVTIDPAFFSQEYQQVGYGRCSSLSFYGPLAVQRSPQLTWEWGGAHPAFSTADETWVGYAERRFDMPPAIQERYRKNTPPYFPSAQGWETGTWREADADCLLTTQDGCE